MRNRRLGPSGLLIAGALVLVVSIVIGQKLGDRVLLQTERRIPVAGAGITPVPEASPEDRTFFRNWKRLQVVAVATDPAFPDPRVTPPPTPTPAPARIRRAVRLTPRPFPTITSIYTSPPLPIPLVSHDPNETEPPIPEASP